MISLKLSGMEGLKKAIKNKENALIQGVDTEIGASITEINAEQKRRVPVDNGFLRSSLHPAKLAPLNWTIVSEGPGSRYAPYQEFGTGGLVNIPQGLEAEAAKFKGRGIRQINMRAQPFFYGPFFTEKPKLIKRIVDLLKK